MPELVLTTKAGHSIEYDPEQDSFFIFTVGAMSRSDAETIAVFIRQAIRLYSVGDGEGRSGARSDSRDSDDAENNGSDETGNNGSDPPPSDGGGPFDSPPPQRKWVTGFD